MDTECRRGTGLDNQNAPKTPLKANSRVSHGVAHGRSRAQTKAPCEPVNVIEVPSPSSAGTSALSLPECP